MAPWLPPVLRGRRGSPWLPFREGFAGAPLCLCVSAAAPSPSELPSFVGVKPFRTSSSRGSAATAHLAAESHGLRLLWGRRAREVRPSPFAPVSRLGLGPLRARWTPGMGAPLAESRAWPHGLAALGPGGARRPRGGWWSPPGRPGALLGGCGGRPPPVPCFWCCSVPSAWPFLGVAVAVVIGLVFGEHALAAASPAVCPTRDRGVCTWKPPDTLWSGQPYRSLRAAPPAS